LPIPSSCQVMSVDSHTYYAARLKPDRSHSLANQHFSAPLFDLLATSTVKLAQRHGRDADPKTVSVSEKRFPENIHAVASVGATELFVKRADQHDAPEALDAGLGLVVPAQPVKHRHAGGTADIRWPAAAARNCQHGAGDRALVGPG